MLYYGYLILYYALINSFYERLEATGWRDSALVHGVCSLPAEVKKKKNLYYIVHSLNVYAFSRNVLRLIVQGWWKVLPH